MAEIKVEKRKPIWPWILGGLVAIALVIFIIAGNDNDNYRDNRTESATADGAEPEYRQEAPAGYTTEDQYGDNRNNDAGDDRAMNDNMNTDESQSDGRAAGSRQGTTAGQGNNDNRDSRQIADFVEFVQTDLREEELDHNKITKAFDKLHDAAESIAEQAGYPKENLDSAKEMSDQIDKDSWENGNASTIKRTMDVYADQLHQMQRAKYPQLETKAMQLVETSRRIRSDQPAMQQTDEIRSFLSEAAELVEDME